MILDGEYRVIYDDKKAVNPYSVHHKWNELGEYGIRKRTKKLIDYADFASCMCFLSAIACKHV